MGAAAERYVLLFVHVGRVAELMRLRTVNSMPIAKGLAAVDMRLEAGAIRYDLRAEALMNLY